MAELFASLIEVVSPTIESLAGEFEQVFVKKSKYARQVDKGVIR